MFPLISVNPLVLCWAVHLQSATAWLGKSAFAHLAFLHGVSLSFAKSIHPTGMISLFSPFGKQAPCSPFLFLQGYAMRITHKRINWGKYSWESHSHQIHTLTSKMPFVAFACEKKSENVPVYPKHIWESRSCSSWATTAGVTGACIPHDWIQVCTALLRHKLEPQIEQSNISALESSRMWLSCVTLSWGCFVALSESPKNTSSLLALTSLHAWPSHPR